MHSPVNRIRAQFAARPDFWIGAALGVAAFMLYLRTMPPTVLERDSGEYQYMAYILGVPHSSGYPLYILLAKLFTFLPFGDVAYRVNLFSVVATALSAPFIYWIARRVNLQRASALVAAMIFLMTPSMWGGALQAKTYALHFLLGILAIFFMLRWHQTGSLCDFYGGALVFGLGLTNHHVIVFLAPALALLVWFNRMRLNRAMIVRGAMLTLIPLALYAYIPIRANQLIAQQDPANWALYQREDAMLKGTVTAYYNNTPQGFLALVTGFDNYFKLGFLSEAEQTNRVSNALNLLFEQFTFAGIAIAVLGAFASFRRDRRVFAFLAAIAAGIGFIAIFLRGVSTVYYFSLCYFAIAVWIGLGIDAFLSLRGAQAPNPFPRVSWGLLRSLAMTLLALVPLSTLIANYSRLDQSSNYDAREHAQAILRDRIARNAVVVAPWEMATPLRYLQFVENQRPDLLIVNVSPIWPQFTAMLDRARELSRPFYNVEFNPEFKRSSDPAFAQAIPLPLDEAPRPKYRSNANIVKEIEVVGYDLDPDPPLPGQPAHVLIYYRVLARMYPMYASILGLGDLSGKPLRDFPSFPGSFFYPTYRWKTGDVYRDAYAFVLPADAPAGLYTLDLNWYPYDLESRATDYDHEFHLALGTIRVGDFAAPSSIAHVQNARVGDALTFLGWDSAPAANSDFISSARGQTLNLDLFWRADRVIPDAYTVFVHLVDARGQVVADADSPPFSGLFPTDRWTVGENLRDRHPLRIRADLVPGDYWIEIGMYVPTTFNRLAIESGSDRADRLVLARVNVR